MKFQLRACNLAVSLISTAVTVITNRDSQPRKRMLSSIRAAVMLVERSTGFEPATGDLRRTCSIQLSYERKGLGLASG